MRIRDELGMRFADRDFTARFPNVGHLAMRPSRLMLVTRFQYLEGLGDRQAADAARRCMDWKDALALELTDPGFPSRCCRHVVIAWWNTTRAVPCGITSW